MIAKFHSAPGHSMETTLTISLPPVQSVRTSRAEREREREREREWEQEQAKAQSKEQEKLEKKEKKEKKKEEQERKKQEQEKRKEAQELRKEQTRQKAAEREREKDEQQQQLIRDHEKERVKVPHERTVSYKDKFQKMRERYDKVTAVHETAQRDLEILNAKMKKLQAENDLLLDALYHGEPALYERYFPRSRSPSPSPNQRPFQHPTSSSMPPPNAMPPPLSSGRSMVPPVSPVNSIGMPPPPPSGSSVGTTNAPTGSMLPPTSAGSTNGFNVTRPPSSAASNPGAISSEGQRTRRSSTSSSRSRRRSDLVGVPLAPDDAEPFESGEMTPTTTRTPARAVDMSYDDEPFRSPRVNGNASTTPRIITSELNGFSSRRPPPEVRESSPSSAFDPQRTREEDQERPTEHDLEIENVHSPAPPGPDDGNGVMHSPVEGEDGDIEAKRTGPRTNDADVMDVDEGKPADSA